jgi:hypothetical protein
MCTASMVRRNSALRADAARTSAMPLRCAAAASLARATSCSSFAAAMAYPASASGWARLNSSARVPISIFLRETAFIRHFLSVGRWITGNPPTVIAWMNVEPARTR